VQITDVSATVVRNPSSLGDDAADETVLVAITASDGTVGWGDANGRSAAVLAFFEGDVAAVDGWDDGIRASLLGADPSDPAELYRQLKEHTFWSCRAGVGHVTLAGTAMALWDLAGKLRSVPVWQLLGARRNPALRAYVTVYHGAAPYRETLALTLDAIDQALAEGFTAIKVEALRNNIDDEGQIVDLAEQARNRAGDSVDLLLDVGYRWRSADDAAPIVRELGHVGLFALEAPLPPESIEEQLRLRELATMPIATGDQLTAASEYFPLIAADAVDIVQGGAPRTGIDDMLAVAAASEARGQRFIPWGWVPTGLAVAANLHACIALANVPLIEYAPPSIFPRGPVRSGLFSPEPSVVGGEFALPTAPGLGMDVDPDLLRSVRR
jgi:L-alanine-DL-glutamate epimerase-like enolase superfamily enzyme